MIRDCDGCVHDCLEDALCSSDDVRRVLGGAGFTTIAALFRTALCRHDWDALGGVLTILERSFSGALNDIVWCTPDPLTGHIGVHPKRLPNIQSLTAYTEPLVVICSGGSEEPTDDGLTRTVLHEMVRMLDAAFVEGGASCNPSVMLACPNLLLHACVYFLSYRGTEDDDTDAVSILASVRHLIPDVLRACDNPSEILRAVVCLDLHTDFSPYFQPALASQYFFEGCGPMTSITGYVFEASSIGIVSDYVRRCFAPKDMEEGDESSLTVRDVLVRGSAVEVFKHVEMRWLERVENHLAGAGDAGVLHLGLPVALTMQVIKFASF